MSVEPPPEPVLRVLVVRRPAQLAALALPPWGTWISHATRFWLRSHTRLLGGTGNALAPPH
jgi:hypothetical protein